MVIEIALGIVLAYGIISFGIPLILCVVAGVGYVGYGVGYLIVMPFYCVMAFIKEWRNGDKLLSMDAGVLAFGCTTLTVIIFFSIAYIASYWC